VRGEAGVTIAEDLVVPEVERLHEALRARGEGDEAAELDDLCLVEVRVQPLPEHVVGEVGVPGDRARVGEGRLLPLVESVRLLEEEDLVDELLGETLRARRLRALTAAVVALDGLGDVEAAELLEPVVDMPVREGRVPVGGKRAQDLGHVRADRLTLRPRRPVAARALEDLAVAGVRERVGVDVADPRHTDNLTRM